MPAWQGRNTLVAAVSSERLGYKRPLQHGIRSATGARMAHSLPATQHGHLATRKVESHLLLASLRQSRSTKEHGCEDALYPVYRGSHYDPSLKHGPLTARGRVEPQQPLYPARENSRTSVSAMIPC